MSMLAYICEQASNLSLCIQTHANPVQVTRVAPRVMIPALERACNDALGWVAGSCVVESSVVALMELVGMITHQTLLALTVALVAMRQNSNN